MSHKQTSPKFLLVLWACSLLSLKIVSCTPTNLRIQVNNENLQNAPYLLDAIKQIENLPPPTGKNISSQLVTENPPSSSLPSNIPSSPTPATSTTTTTSSSISKPTADNRAGGQPTLTNVTLPSDLLPSSNRTSDEDLEEDLESHNSFNVVKEENIEEVLELDPENGSKLSPTDDGLTLETNDQPKIADLASAENTHSNTDGRESVSFESDKVSSVVTKHDRKPQLPVTSSHLKKPYGAIDDELETSSSIRNVNGTTLSGGAKSLVSPSVIADDTIDPQAQKIIKKLPTNLPDTLEPSQIMNGVTNASAVPGIVNKEYGHQTRTRITLGGGYVRDRLPPLVNPSSDRYVDNKPEKPVTPLEKPTKIQTSIVEKGEKREIEDNESSSSVDSVNYNKNNSMKLGSPDPRCPKEGVITLEHPNACDKYFYCEDGLITEHICPNGLMYGTRELIQDYCVHRWKADCGDKSIPNPISSPGCRWQYGIFNVQGSPKCSPDYYECTAGKFEVKKCSVDGQVFDDRTKTCRYAEQVGCANEALADFHCPPDDQANTYWPFPRYFLNERALIHCVNDKPEIVRCTDNERVDPEHLHCIPIAKQQNNPPAVNLETRRARERKKST